VAQSESKGVVIIALLGNVAIAISKLAAAAITGSSAMLSEGVHSVADTANEFLLLHGIRLASMPPDTEHPFGRGREVYFWSFIVALLIFALGAGVSFYEGVHRFLVPAPVTHVAVSFAVLGASFVFEGISWSVALRRVQRAKGDRSYFQAVRRSKDPAVFTVLLEDTAALLGILAAFAGIALSSWTGRSEFDAAASLVIAALLCVTSFLLARETKGLLIGEPAHAHVRESLMEIAERNESISHANGIVTAQLGPDHILAALSAEFEDHLTTPQIEACVQQLEREFKNAHPQVVAMFVKPQTRSVWEAKRAALDSSSD
jgi:cation diffusion facilitator family transporter